MGCGPCDGRWPHDPPLHFPCDEYDSVKYGLRGLFRLWEMPSETRSFAGHQDDLDED